MEKKERELLNNEEKRIEDIKVRVKKATEKLASTNLTDVQDNRVFAVDKQKTVDEVQDEVHSLKKSLDEIINKQFMSQQGMFDVPLDQIQKTWTDTDASLDKSSKTKYDEEADTEDDSLIQRQELVQQRIEREMKETERRRKEVEERQRQRKSLQVQLDTAAKIAEDAKEDSSSNIVVMRKKPAQSASDASIPSYQRHSMAEDQMDADGYTRYKSSDEQSPRRKTLHESGFKTADQLMQQISEDERRRKASYNILKNRMTDNAQKSEFLQSNVVNTTKLDAGYVPTRNQRNEPVYYGQDSKTRLLHSQSARTVNTEEELKDEALAIRLAADIASKKALDEIKSPTSSSSSSSRQRIREILQKQREDHEKRSEENKYAVEEKVKSAFDPTNRKLLWVFR